MSFAKIFFGLLMLTSCLPVKPGNYLKSVDSGLATFNAIDASKGEYHYRQSLVTRVELMSIP